MIVPLGRDQRGGAKTSIAFGSTLKCAGVEVTISPSAFTGISSSVSTSNSTQRAVHTSLTREGVKRSPEYDESALLDRQYEEMLHEAHQRAGYWE